MEALSITTPIEPNIAHFVSRLTKTLQRLTTYMLETYQHLHASLSWLHLQLTLHVHPFFPHLLYFITLALTGSLALHLIDTRAPGYTPPYIDLLYMSVSALTVSGLNSVELEAFSTAQIMVLTLLMLAGGEVFLAFLCVLFRSSEPESIDPPRVANSSTLELGRIDSAVELARVMRHRSLESLVFVILLYLAAFHVTGTIAIAMYVRYTASARSVLKSKGLPLLPYAISLTVSSFANGGLTPNNENMLIFVKDSGLLIIIVVLVFVGNTMFAAVLRAVVYVLYRLTGREEYGYMLRSGEKIGFPHMMGKRTTWVSAGSVAAIFAAQLVVFLGMEWNKSYFEGVGAFQKVVSGVFQAANSRHCGESSIDVSQVSAAVSVVFIVAMFLPAYASFDPFESQNGGGYSRDRGSEKAWWHWLNIVSLPQVFYIVIFVFLVCIIEKDKMYSDPINYSFLFITFEVVSAYGNVGFSTGYACARQLHPDSSCKDLWIGLSGKWSNAGKLVIMFVMLFGRLKKFHLAGGKSWRLS